MPSISPFFTELLYIKKQECIMVKYFKDVNTGIFVVLLFFEYGKD